jgi:hypothetical protein
MSFSNVKNIHYIVKKMFLGIWYSLYLFQFFSNETLLYAFTKHFKYWFDLTL